MKSVFMLAAANLRRHKGAGILLGLMVLIAALLLNLGLLSFFGVSTLINRKVSERNTPSISAILADQIGKTRQADFERLISDSAGVTETQSENVLFFASASFSLKGSGSYSNTVVFENSDKSVGKMGKFNLVGDHNRPSRDSIYVPYILKAKGYRLGDSFTLTYRGKPYDFTVAGFTEDILLGTLNTGGIRFFLPDAAYQKFTEELNTPETQAVMFSARTKTVGQASDIYDTVYKQTAQNPLDEMRINVFSMDIVELADSLPADIGASMEIAFAFIVALVLLLVVRFRIVNSIEQDMRNIGALEAVGFTCRQIRGGFMLQFLTTALLGSLAGIALSYAVAIPHGQILASETGLDWVQPFNPSVNLITLTLILVCVALVAFSATRRIRRLPVIVALRGGITTHSFRKNHLTLARTRGPLNLLLSMKTMFANMRQNIALVIILASVSFASVFIFMLFYNFEVNDTAVMHTLGGETNDILIGAQSPDNAQSLLKELPKLTNITQAIDFGNATLDVDGKAGYGRITTDYSKIKNNQAYAGRYPKHDNEAAIGGSLAAKLHKGVGDTVRITCGDESRNFIITGLTQSINTLGKGVFLTDDGMRRINPKYSPASVYVYVPKNANVPEVMQDIRSKFSSEINAISNDRASTQSMLGTYESVVAAFAVIIFAVMGLIVILILALITGTTVVRRRQELGIEKAVGFTTLQLIIQISLGFLPAAFIGSFAGGVLGWFESNPLMSLMFRGMGIMKVEFYLPAVSVPAVCAAIVLLTLVISVFTASGIRKISPCALVSE